MVRSTARTAFAQAEGGSTLNDGQMKSPRLRVDVEKQLASFNLRVQIEVGAEILVLFGPSGAGKTQTLNAIAGLMTPDAGEITLDGTVFFRAASKPGVPTLNLPARKRRVGYVFQQYALFPHFSALENVSYALWRQPHARERAEALLERMRLSELANRYPHELSGGQQQRVAIARALAMEPHVLLMDEPFSALDSEIRKQLHHDLLQLQSESELIVIYVTHNLEDAFTLGHRLAVVRDGKIERIGTPADMYPQRTNSILMTGLRPPLESRTG
jgi:molybdate transport system ATP-binding protein